jgi:hypothetical protein
VVDVITADPELWADTMMREELGYGTTEPLAVLDGRLRIESPEDGGRLVGAAIPLGGSSRLMADRPHQRPALDQQTS